MAEAKRDKAFLTATSTGSNVSVSVETFTSTTTSPWVDRVVVAKVEKDREQELRRIETAVFSHIKAIRALGKTSVNTAEIADALSISLQDVDRAVTGLKQKGVLSGA